MEDTRRRPSENKSATAVGTSSRRPGFGTVTAYFMVNDQLNELIEFCQEAYGAIETYRARGSAGGWHVELQIGDTRIMLGGQLSLEEEQNEQQQDTITQQPSNDQPKHKQPAIPTMLFLYVNDTDAVYKAAIAAGATSMMEPAANFQESRGAAVVDPVGNTWFLATHDPSTTRIHH